MSTSEIDMSIKIPFDPENLDYSNLLSSSGLDMVDWPLSTDDGLLAEDTVPVTPTVSTAHSPGSSHEELSPVCIRSTSHSSNQATPPPTKAGRSAKQSPREDELVRKIHHKVGGPSKLSTYEEPSRVRLIVIEALASEQLQPSEAERIRRGQLSALERRVVRTVTNRGAAVRSRMRQRREMTSLRAQVRARDGRVKQLEAVVRALCSAYAVPLPPSIIPTQQPVAQGKQVDFSLPAFAGSQTNRVQGEVNLQSLWDDGRCSSSKMLDLFPVVPQQPPVSTSVENISQKMSWS